MCIHWNDNRENTSLNFAIFLSSCKTQRHYNNFKSSNRFLNKLLFKAKIAYKTCVIRVLSKFFKFQNKSNLQTNARKIAILLYMHIWKFETIKRKHIRFERKFVSIKWIHCMIRTLIALTFFVFRFLTKLN